MATKKGKTLTAAEIRVRDSSLAAGKKAKFIELGQKRMNKAVHAISQLRNLANRNNYMYTDAQVSTMIRMLKITVSNVEDAFKKPEKGATNGGFTFE